jgi:hypothetical protein
MVLTNPRIDAAIQASLNYIVPLWDRCVPGIAKRPLAGSKEQVFAEPAARTPVQF